MKKSKARCIALLFALLHVGSVGKATKDPLSSPYSPRQSLAATAGATKTGAYVESCAPLAVELMVKYGVPASIILAQSIIESAWGTSALIKATNNSFGMKCKDGCQKNDHCILYNDSGRWSRFFVYKSVAESFEDHSKRLCAGRYKFFRCEYGRDWRQWADGLQKKGYAVDRRYAEKLKNIIQKYGLYHYDAAKSDSDPAYWAERLR